MKKHHLIPFVFVFFVACSDNNKETSSTSDGDTSKMETAMPVGTVKHVNWELGNVSNVNKILEMYKMWDEKTPFLTTDYFADTVWLNIPEVRKEFVVPNNQITKRLAENRAQYKGTSNDILSSVSLHDKVTGEDWVMVTAYSKWVELDGKRDSVLYHDDWRLVNGKVDKLISFYKLPPKGFQKDTTAR